MHSLVTPGDQNTKDVLKKADDFIDKCNEEKSIKKRPPRDNTGRGSRGSLHLPKSRILCVVNYQRSPSVSMYSCSL